LEIFEGALSSRRKRTETIISGPKKNASGKYNEGDNFYANPLKPLDPAGSGKGGYS
jgi:hypothetical protein